MGSGMDGGKKMGKFKGGSCKNNNKKTVFGRLWQTEIGK